MPRLGPLSAGVIAAVILSGTTGEVHAAIPEGPRWEVTLGVASKQSGEGSEHTLPRAEIKYQWSVRLELETRFGWEAVNPAQGRAQSGPGMVEIAVKYRFVDRERAGFDMSVFPQINRSVSPSAVRRGIGSDNSEYLLGLEIKLMAGDTEFEIRSARNFIEREPDEWALELKATAPCMAKTACELTTERKFQRHEIGHTLLKMGLNWEVLPGYVLKTAIGREFGPYEPGRNNRIVSAELQMLF